MKLESVKERDFPIVDIMIIWYNFDLFVSTSYIVSQRIWSQTSLRKLLLDLRTKDYRFVFIMIVMNCSLARILIERCDIAMVEIYLDYALSIFRWGVIE